MNVDGRSIRIRISIDRLTRVIGLLSVTEVDVMENKKLSWPRSFVSQTMGPILLIVFSSNLAMSLVYLIVVEKGDLQVITKHGLVKFLYQAWKSSMVFDSEAVAIIAGFSVWSASSFFVLGGKTYFGPLTINGHRPQYTMSGFKYYIISMLTIGSLLSQISAWYWYSKFHIIMFHLIVFGYMVTLFLYIKGLTYPSPGEHGSSGNIIFDYYWGLELYPRLGERFDLKQWTNSRFGMMVMQITALFCWKAQVESSGWNWAMATTAILQTVYLAKFYWWEDGYMNTIDIIFDRAGYYICWGCLCIVPSLYTVVSVYMVEHSPDLEFGTAVCIVSIGISSIGLNYWCDYQKQVVLATDGKCTIWGKPPIIIRTTYQDSTGVTRRGILLASGFWGVARHVNYVFEILLHICWAIPALFSSPLPYFHLIFLIILLVHRTYRDNLKCQRKYGVFWDKYCDLCPYNMIPGIF